MNRFSRSQVEQTLRTFSARRDNIKRVTNMNLSDSSQCARFVAMLEKVEKADSKSNGVLSNWEREFVVDLRERFETREDALDLGCTPWSPTLKQWNTLHNIASML